MIIFLLRPFALIAFLIAIAYLFISTLNPETFSKCLFIGLALWVASEVPWGVISEYFPARRNPPARQ